MPAYLIADVDVKDAEAYTAYREANPGIVEQFGGKYLAVGGEAKAIEGEWQPSRMILIEFPSMEQLEAFYASGAYGEIRPIRWRTADSRLITLDGLSD